MATGGVLAFQTLARAFGFRDGLRGGDEGPGPTSGLSGRNDRQQDAEKLSFAQAAQDDKGDVGRL